MKNQINLSNFLNPYGYIYCHQNTINGKRYIGANVSRKTSRNRFINGKRRTLKAFLDAYKRNIYFCNALKKNSIKKFKTTVLDFTTDLKDTEKKEAFYIRKYKTLNREYGYNLKISGFNGLLSEETKKKMSESLKGRKLSEEWKKKISENSARYWKGKKFSEEYKKKLRENHKGMRGRKHSKETLKKMSEAQKGEKSHGFGKPLTKEHKMKVSKALKGHKVSEETRKKISDAKKNPSDGTRKKLSDAQKGKLFYCFKCKTYHYDSSIRGKNHLEYKKEVMK